MSYCAENEHINVLVVDDHAMTRNMVKAILVSLGFKNILQAENGTFAVQRIQEEPIDLVICDWNMPQMSGLEVLKKVRLDERYTKLPFLMLTAEAYRENVNAAMQSGVSDYIIKPFTAEILAGKLENIISSNKQLKEKRFD